MKDNLRHIDFYQSLTKFLAKIESEGFPIAISHWEKLYSLLAALENPLDAKFYLAPLLAKTPEQQQKFFQLFDTHFANYKKEKIEVEVPLAPSREDIEETPTDFLSADTSEQASSKEEKSTESEEDINGQKWVLFSCLLSAVSLGVSWWLGFSFWLSWLILALVFIFIIYGTWRYYLARNRKIAVRQEKMDGGERMFWDFKLPPYQLIQFGDVFKFLAKRMRDRVPSLHEKLNVRATVQASVKAGGLLVPTYKIKTEQPAYIFLIDYSNPNNHRTKLYDAWYQWLRDRDIWIVRYYFRSDPRFLWQADSSNTFSLETIAEQNNTSRLFLLGDAWRLLNPVSGKPYEWAKPFFQWPERFIITPIARPQWTWRETQLQSLFFIVPFNSEGLLTLEKQLNPEEQINKVLYRLPKTERITLDEKGLPDSLSNYLRNELLEKWVAALAFFPQLNWNLTVFLGKILKEKHNQKGLLSFENLRQLTRIYWFYNGFISETAREKLYDILPPEEQQQIHKTIANFLEKQKEQKEQFFSLEKNEIDLQILLHKAAAGEATKTELKALKKLAKDEEQDFLIARYTKNPKPWEWILPQGFEFLVPEKEEREWLTQTIRDLFQFSTNEKENSNQDIGEKESPEEMNTIDVVEDVVIQADIIEKIDSDEVDENSFVDKVKLPKRIEEAILMYQETPNDKAAITGMADALKSMGKLEESLAMYEGALKKFPNDKIVIVGYADILKSMGRLEEALEIYNEIREKFPDDLIVNVGYADTLKLRGRLEEALEVYNEIREKFSNNMMASIGYAEVLKSMERFEETLVVYEEILEKFPDNVVAITGMANTFKSMGRLTDALIVYEEARGKFPNNVVVIIGYADTLKLRGSLEEALTVYEEARRKFPNDKIASVGYAEVLKSIEEITDKENDVEDNPTEKTEIPVRKTENIVRERGKGYQSGQTRKFSPQVKKAISNSRMEALRLGHDYIGTEHLLLGIIREEKDLAVKVLNSLDVNSDELIQVVEDSIERRPSLNASLTIENIPLNKDAENVLKFSFLEAKRLKVYEIEIEHIVLSILKHTNNPAAHVLEQFEVDYDTFKAELEYIRHQEGFIEEEDNEYVEEDIQTHIQEKEPPKPTPEIRIGENLIQSETPSTQNLAKLVLDLDEERKKIKKEKDIAIEKEQLEKATELRDNESKLTRQLEIAKIDLEEEIRIHHDPILNLKGALSPILELNDAIKKIQERQKEALVKLNYEEAFSLKKEASKLIQRLKNDIILWEDASRKKLINILKDAEFPPHLFEYYLDINKVKEDKYQAVKDQQYERAADLRDDEFKLIRQLEIAKIDCLEDSVQLLEFKDLEKIKMGLRQIMIMNIEEVLKRIEELAIENSPLQRNLNSFKGMIKGKELDFLDIVSYNIDHESLQFFQNLLSLINNITESDLKPDPDILK